MAVLAGAGAQRFFDRAARDGLFPPATLLGAELAVRDDLGHGLAWGLDCALGGGRGRGEAARRGSHPRHVRRGRGRRLALEGLPASGALTLSGGARVAFTWLARTFPPEREPPGQYFFTVDAGPHRAAPGASRARLSAVAPGRVSFLFYNVDKNENLGFADVLFGVEYALVD